VEEVRAPREVAILCGRQIYIQKGPCAGSYIHKMNRPGHGHRQPAERRGDPDGIASAYRAQASALYRYAVMVTGDAPMAEDAIQQVFLKLLKARRPSPAALQARYLRRAVRNECYRLLSQRRQPAELNDGNLLAPANGHLTDGEEQAAVETALRRLPPDQREVIHMKIYEQMTFQQIAEQLDESINTVAGRYRYGLEKLRQWLSPSWDHVK